MFIFFRVRALIIFWHISRENVKICSNIFFITGLYNGLGTVVGHSRELLGSFMKYCSYLLNCIVDYFKYISDENDEMWLGNSVHKKDV